MPTADGNCCHRYGTSVGYDTESNGGIHRLQGIYPQSLLYNDGKPSQEGCLLSDAHLQRIYAYRVSILSKFDKWRKIDLSIRRSWLRVDVWGLYV